MRFSKSEGEWQVLRNTTIIYLGQKNDCLHFMDMQLMMAKKH
ncbi:MAG: hypothetical protein RIM99_18240 [Cyclobacteriaceae bacterium]